VKRIQTFIAGLLIAAFHISAIAAPSPIEIINNAENTIWGKTLNSSLDMTIVTSSWSRTLSLKVWMNRPEKAFLRVVGPAKDKGILSLRIGTEMWNYIPAIERTIKIPPSLMLQPWLGSDFTNDDLVKESSLVNDYTHKLVNQHKVDGLDVYEIEGLPKPSATVVWGKIIYTIRQDYVPLKLQYFDERGNLVRTLTYSNIQEMGGRMIPTKWEMKPENKPGKSTTVSLKSVIYDKPLDNEIFSLRNLGKTND